MRVSIGPRVRKSRSTYYTVRASVNTGPNPGERASEGFQRQSVYADYFPASGCSASDFYFAARYVEEFRKQPYQFLVGRAVHRRRGKSHPEQSVVFARDCAS